MFDQRRLYGRNRSRATAWGPYSEFCKSGHFWRLPILHSLGCNVVLRGRRGTSWHCHVSPNVPKILVCGRCNTFARLSVDELHFAWPAQHFRCVALRVFRESQSRLRVQWWQRGTWQAWHFVHCRGCVKWWHGVTCVAGVGHRERIILRGRRSSSDPVHSTHSTPHSALSTPHSTLSTLHSTLHTPCSTHRTLHSTLYTLHSTLYTPHSTLCTPHFTLYTPHATLYPVHFTLCTPHSTLHTFLPTPFTSHFTLRTPQSPLHTLHTTFHTQHFTFFTPHTFHSTVFCLAESTVHWYGNRGKMHKTVQIICFTEVFYCIRVRGLHLVCFFVGRSATKARIGRNIRRERCGDQGREGLKDNIHHTLNLPWLRVSKMERGTTNGLMVYFMDNPIEKMDDLGVPIF